MHQNIYGTSFAAVRKVSKSGKICLLDIDVQGAELVKKSDLKAAYVFIAPPSMKELERRLRGRGTETEDAVLKRLENARTEMAKKDVDGFFDAVIVNDDVDKAYDALKAVIAAHVDVAGGGGAASLAKFGPAAFGIACAIAIAASIIVVAAVIIVIDFVAVLSTVVVPIAIIAVGVVDFAIIVIVVPS